MTTPRRPLARQLPVWRLFCGCGGGAIQGRDREGQAVRRGLELVISARFFPEAAGALGLSFRIGPGLEDRREELLEGLAPDLRVLALIERGLLGIWIR